MDFQKVNGVHFRVNSVTGQYYCYEISTREVKLNADLH